MKTLLDSPNSHWKKLLSIYQKIEISDEFINCADAQLTPLFEKETGIKVVDKIRLAWDEELVTYQKAPISKLNAKLWLKYGFNSVNIIWKSASGRIYELKDSDIDCHDIQFWFEGLDPVLCKQLWKPKWSLITFEDIYINNFASKHNLQLSKKFAQCMNKQLSASFVRLIGLNIDKEISLAWEEEGFSYTKGEISSLASQLYIHHNWNPVNILWKSKSSRIYDISDNDIDNRDIEFWFENLDIQMIQKQVYKKGTLPFRLKDLTYELNVGNFGINCQLDMKIKGEDVLSIDSYTRSIDRFIIIYNETSEKHNRNNGVIHNWSHNLESDVVIYEIDLGSTGADFMKKLLNHLSKMNCFEKVNIS